MKRRLAFTVAGLLVMAGPGARSVHPQLSPAAGRVRDLQTERASANDNRVPAGVLENGTLTVALELRNSVWMPNGDSGIGIPVAAFAEAGKAASIPGPLLRVVAGTRLHISLHNLLDVPEVVRGLRDHDGVADSLVLAAGEARDISFTARAVGTHFYFARGMAATEIMSRGAESQLAGALIVDPPGSSPALNASRDRIFVMTAWEDTLLDEHLRYRKRRMYAINGLSWPHTEHLSYAIGDTIRWRVINTSMHAHPMHLHGFYFSVLSHGTPLGDTVYDAADRHSAATELMPIATTMSLQWSPDRAGNWLYHCHFINHVDTDLRLTATESPRAPMSTMGHSRLADAMSGLVMTVTVRDTANERRKKREPSRRRLRLFVNERMAPAGAQSSYAFVLQQGARAPAPDSIQLPGSTLELHQGEPTQITVINHARHSTVVHWHGIELESYYDGVAGWSGADAFTAPIIAPGDSFIVKLTPPRAGTFIYHTHADELTQITSGLYGALLVLPPHSRRDPSDRLIIFSDSAAPDMHDTPPSLVNGTSVPAPIELCAGRTHRIRFISISAVSGRRLRLLDDTTLVHWTSLAKDGQELPRAQQITTPATARFGTGETRDVAFAPLHPGSYELEVIATYNVPRVMRVPVIAGACNAHGLKLTAR